MGKTPENGIYPVHPLSRLAMDAIGGYFYPYVLVSEMSLENIEEVRKEKEKAGTGIILMVNHLSNADGPVIGKALREADFPGEPIFLQGKKMNNNVVTDILIKSEQRIVVWPPSLVPRNDAEINERARLTKVPFESAKALLQRGETLVIFPEASRSRTGALMSAEPKVSGYISIAPKNTLIVPVGLYGTEKILPVGQKMPSVYAPTVVFGQAMTTGALQEMYADLPKHEARKAMIDHVMGDVAKLLPEEYRGVYSDRVRNDTSY